MSWWSLSKGPGNPKYYGKTRERKENQQHTRKGREAAALEDQELACESLIKDIRCVIVVYSVKEVWEWTVAI